jgi:hypothetical protein
MTQKLADITSTLRSMNVDPTVIKMVQAEVKKAEAPEIDITVQARLREVASEHGRALLVLGRNGGYSVFTPEGHASLRANARKNKPWESSKHKRSSNHKKPVHH